MAWEACAECVKDAPSETQEVRSEKASGKEK